MDLPGLITLGFPEALILGAVLVWLFVRHVKNKNVWRWAALVIAIILLTYPSIVHLSRSLDLYVIVDRSRSISGESREKQLEILEYLSDRLDSDDRMGIISFNDRPYVEQIPGAKARLTSFEIPYSEDSSDLSAAIDLVLNQADPNRRSEILILSDGEYTAQDPVRLAYLARQYDIPINYRNLKRAEVFNLAVQEVETPDKVVANEPYRVTFRVTSTIATKGRYRIYRNDRIIGEEENNGWHEYDFLQGVNTIRFVDNLKQPGIHAYKVEVEGVGVEEETIARDNIAERFIRVLGPKPILLVNNTGQSDNVTQILSAGGIQTHVIHIDRFRMGINQLAGYQGLILNNVSILNLRFNQIEAIRDFVVQEGGGLLICGGNRSYSNGGYYKSAIDPIIPMSLEDRQSSKKIATAFSIVLDRSGSMQMQTPSGETKMSLANTAAASCVELMGPTDSVSVIAVDSIAHIMIDQQYVVDPVPIVDRILRIESMGGGIFTYTGLLAAGSEIVDAKQINKHVLLFADANDAEEPGEYIQLLKDFTDAGITVSVVGLGTEDGVDANFLKDIAEKGNGSVYFTEDPEQLIQFFTADTITYTRNSFVEDVAPMSILAGAHTLSPASKWNDFSCSDYNLLFSKPEAEVAIMTADQDRAPILAYWQRGLGRVVGLALDPNLAFTASSNYPDVMLAAARWMTASNVQDNFQVAVDYQGNAATVSMEIADEERLKAGRARLKIFTPNGETIERPMYWDSLNRVASDMRLLETGCYRGVIEVGDQSFKIPPMSVPVSPEFLYDRPTDFGKRSMSQMASMTEGEEVLDLATLFQRDAFVLAKSPVIVPFVIALLVLLLLDILEARFGIQPYLAAQFARFFGKVRTMKPKRSPAPQTQPAGVAAQASTRQGKPAAGSQTAAEPTADSESKTPEKPAAPPPPADDGFDYLTAAKHKADRGIKGNK